MTTLPSLFLSHGAPDLPLTDHPAKQFMGELAATMPKPRAILIISAHWQTTSPRLSAAPAPDTIYDFGGFPDALYQMTYPAKTDQAVIERTQALLAEAGMTPEVDTKRGYDHGAWVPLILTYPDASVPVMQLSLLRKGDSEAHFQLGKVLAPLRDEGILIIGSGAATHNLRQMTREGTPPPAWALDFNQWLNDNVVSRDVDELKAFPSRPAMARDAHPTDEHLMPLFVAMGAGWDGGESRRIHNSFSYGSISMAAFAFGAADELPNLERQGEAA